MARKVGLESLVDAAFWQHYFRMQQSKTHMLGLEIYMVDAAANAVGSITEVLLQI